MLVLVQMTLPNIAIWPSSSDEHLLLTAVSLCTLHYTAEQGNEREGEIDRKLKAMG